MKVFAWICAGLMALAVIPAYADSGCSEKHENVSRFNPTELSDYQKCVYEWAGRTSGTHAGFVWFSIDGKFHHISNDEIIAASDDGIERLIVKTILEDNVAEKLEHAQAMLELASTNERKFATEIVQLKSDVSKYKTIVDNAAAIAATLTNNGRGTFSIPLPITFNYMMFPEGHPDRGAGLRTTQHVDAANTSRITFLSDTKTGDYYVTFLGAESEDPINNPRTEFLVNLGTNVVFDDVKGVIDSVIESAYNAGYADGYRDGYADGYKDGAAGRASRL